MRALLGVMAPKTTRTLKTLALALAQKQHGVVERLQLRALGFTPDAIKHLVAAGFLHPLFRGVYAVGRPDVGQLGRWMGAVLSSGPGAALYCESAAALWRIRTKEPRTIEVVVAGAGGRRHRDGIVVRTCRWLEPHHLTKQRGIPVTTPIETVMALAERLSRRRLEAAINEADSLGLIKVPTLREALSDNRGRPGVPLLRDILDPATFVLTESELERLFLPIARRAGLAKPETRRYVDSYRTDFFWHDLGLVVETDSLRYHRTHIQQTKDRARDHAHLAAGRTPVRFTHDQIAHQPEHVETMLRTLTRA